MREQRDTEGVNGEGFKSVNGPSDLFEFPATISPVSREGGQERAAMKDKNGERGTAGEQRENSIICDPLTVADVHLLHIYTQSIRM